MKSFTRTALDDRRLKLTLLVSPGPAEYETLLEPSNPDVPTDTELEAIASPAPIPAKAIPVRHISLRAEKLSLIFILRGSYRPPPTGVRF